MHINNNFCFINNLFLSSDKTNIIDLHLKKIGRRKTYNGERNFTSGGRKTAF